MLYVVDLPETDAVRIVRYLLSVAAAVVDEGRDSVSIEVGAEEAQECDAGQPEAKRRMLQAKGDRGHAEEPATGAEGKGEVKESAAVKVKVMEESPLSDDFKKRRKPKLGVLGAGMGGAGEREGVVTATVEGMVVKLKRKEGSEDARATADNPHKGTNGVVANGHHYPSSTGAHEIDGGTSSESGGASEGEGVVVQAGDDAHAESAESGGEVKGGSTGDPRGIQERKGLRPKAWVTLPPSTFAALRAERALRVALTLPYNEAFLRSALAELREVEVVVVLKVWSTQTYREAAFVKPVPLGWNFAVCWYRVRSM